MRRFAVSLARETAARPLFRRAAQLARCEGHRLYPIAPG